MSWIKDNLILILAVATLVLGTGWVIDHYISVARYAELETDFTRVSSQHEALSTANKAEVEKLVALQAEYNALVERHRVDRENLESALARVAAMNKQLDAQMVENEALRDQIALENPDVDSYMRAGMPCALADSLWPGAYDCP